MKTFGSLFAGVGGFDLGFERAGWEVAWQVEWDKRCRSVLARHWPDVTRYGDVREVHGGEIEPVDCITYGFPCQDLSVAGKRAGLDGERSGLFFEAVRVIDEMRSATGGRYPTWAVAENVPGLLSADRGDAMGRCLDTLAESGAVELEWGVVDAQHLGLPQRRKRVFLIARYGAGRRSGREILPLTEGRAGSVESKRTRREVVAALTSTGVGTCGADDNQGQAGHLIPDVYPTLRTHIRNNSNPNTEAAMLIPAVKSRRAQTAKDYETWVDGDVVAPTLNAFDNGTETRATVLIARSFDWQANSDRGPITDPPNVTRPLVVNRMLAVHEEVGVRRLTPRECERLQGFPDDHTRYDADDKSLPDGFRYKAMGNAVAVPVAEWIARRISIAQSAWLLDQWEKALCA